MEKELVNERRRLDRALPGDNMEVAALHQRVKQVLMLFQM
jgi:hypothetical protein